MTKDELFNEAKVIGYDACLRLSWRFEQELPKDPTKEDVVEAVRKIRDRVLLRCDDIICFAREESDK